MCAADQADHAVRHLIFVPEFVAVAGVFIRRGGRGKAVLIRAKDAAWAQICAESDGSVSAVRRDRERFPVRVVPNRHGVLPHIAVTSPAARRRSAGTSQVSLCYQPADRKSTRLNSSHLVIS